MDNVKEDYMRLALVEAKNALEIGEVPVGCVFVHEDENGLCKVIARGSNRTNKYRNGTKHAEVMAIDDIILKQGLPASIFRECDLYVTCEPCIMCAAAIGKLNIRSVYFGCKNERFGGNGSILSVHNQTDANSGMKSYPIHSGMLEKEAIDLFQNFYSMENERAPEHKRRKKSGQE